MFSALIVLLKGWIIGVIIAAPVGPVGLICIRRSLSHGWLAGMRAGLGAVFADALLGAGAVFGVVVISDFVLAYQNIFKIFGGTILCGLGIKILLDHAPQSPESISSKQLPQKELRPWNDFAVSFMVTITNPGTIFAFLAIFAGLGFGDYTNDYTAALTLTCGIFLGSLSWWWGLSFFVYYFAGHLEKNIHDKVSLISGVLIIGFGIFSFLSLGLARIE